MLPYIAEFIGTMLLIILGDGVVANVTLNKSGMKGAGSISNYSGLGACCYDSGVYLWRRLRGAF